MHEEEEAMPMESQAEPMEVEDDSPYLDLEGDRELQAYALIKDRVFSHTLAYDLDFLEKIGMDAYFLDVAMNAWTRGGCSSSSGDSCSYSRRFLG
jgi:hypothetical protein